MTKYLNPTRRRDVKKYVVVDGKLSLDATIVSKEERNGDLHYKVRFNSGKEYSYPSSRCQIVCETEVIQGPFVLSVCKNRNWTQVEYDRDALISVIQIPGEDHNRYIMDGEELSANRVFLPLGEMECTYFLLNNEKRGWPIGPMQRAFINKTQTHYAAVLQNGAIHTYNNDKYTVFTKEKEYERDQVIIVKRTETMTPRDYERICVYKSISSSRCYYEVFYVKDGASKKALYFDTDYELLFPNHTQSHIPVEGIIATYRGRRERDLQEISCFCDEHSNNYLKLINHKGRTDICPEKEVELEHLTTDIRASNIRAYLKDVASIEKLSVGSASEEGDIQEEEKRLVSLGDKFEKLEVTDGSVLSSFLTGDKDSLFQAKDAPIAIFPFGCNHSQMVAVQNALSNSLSTIQGPPGTGKTQTILNIIANLILNHKTVEVVSNNNSAVENILEKLDSKNMAFFVAKLGKGDNKDTFLASQQPGMIDIPDEWCVIGRRRAEIRDSISKLNSLLPCLYKKDNELHRLLAEYNDFLFQKNTFDAKYPHAGDLINKWTRKLLNSRSRVLLAKRIQERPTGGRIRIWIWEFIQSIHRFVIGLPQGGDLDVALDYLCLGYEKSERDDRIAELRSLLSENEYSTENKKLTELSMTLFKGELYDRYAHHDRQKFNKDDLWKQPYEFLKEFPVILSTTFSAVSALSRDVRYDYVIMDEASQVDVAAGVLSLSVAKNAVIVGDEKQLPNVVSEEFKKKAAVFAQQYGIKENYNYVSNSFLSSIRKTLSPPDVTLCEHYRCHPLIIEFCNREFYGGQLVIMTQGSFADSAMILQRTVEGNHQRGKMNQRQVDEIKQKIDQWRPAGDASVGIIAPFKAQVAQINSCLPGLEAATVHRFQGREKDVIIFSTVENTIGDFVADPHLLNVAVSRAKCRFVLVASAEESEDKHMKDLMDYIRYYSKGESKGEVTSVFDLLYGSKSDELEKVLKRIPIVSSVISENLYATVITRVLNKHHMNDEIQVSNEYPLRYVVDFSRETNFTDDEILYGTREGTHLDFLLTNIVTHNPVLAIEVDGVRFHREGTEQHDRRDKLKNSIMEKAGIPLKRVSTDASGLEADLEQKLIEIGVIEKGVTRKDT